MKYCPRCKRMVELIEHIYPSNDERRIKYVCSRCGHIIQIVHLPKRTIKRYEPWKRCRKNLAKELRNEIHKAA